MSDLAEEGEASEPPLVRMRPRDLLVAGLTGGRVAVVAAIVGWAFQLPPEGALVVNLDRLAGADRSDLETALLVVGVLLLASILISLATTVVVYWGFTARRSEDRLVITRGLLQTRRSVIPVGTDPGDPLEENLIRRAFGLASLRVLTAGYGRDSGDQQQASVLVPVADPRAMPRGRGGRPGSRTACGWPTSVPHPHRHSSVASPSPRSSGSPPSPSGLALPEERTTGDLPRAPGLAIGFGYLSWRALGHTVLPRHVVARSGALQRRTTVAARANLQHLTLHRSPTQRPFSLASLTLAIPKASASVIDVDDDLAEERFDELAARLSGPR